MEVVPFRFVVGDKREALKPCERRAIGLVITTVDRDQIVNSVEIDESHGRADLGQFGVRAGGDDIVGAGKTEVPHKANGLGQFVIVGRDRAALEGVIEFRRVKAEHLRLAETADHATAETASECVRRIEEELQSVLVGDLL